MMNAIPPTSLASFSDLKARDDHSDLRGLTTHQKAFVSLMSVFIFLSILALYALWRREMIQALDDINERRTANGKKVLAWDGIGGIDLSRTYRARNKSQAQGKTKNTSTTTSTSSASAPKTSSTDTTTNTSSTSSTSVPVRNTNYSQPLNRPRSSLHSTLCDVLG